MFMCPSLNPPGGDLKTAFMLNPPPADQQVIMMYSFYLFEDMTYSIQHVFYRPINHHITSLLVINQDCASIKLIVGNKYSYVLCLMSVNRLPAYDKVLTSSVSDPHIFYTDPVPGFFIMRFRNQGFSCGSRSRCGSGSSLKCNISIKEFTENSSTDW